jgi:glycosyltransferase involved in cell wall biosynthesis
MRIAHIVLFAYFTIQNTQLSNALNSFAVFCSSIDFKIKALRPYFRTMQTCIICTVTNDLTHDQRMQRICSTLVEAGYQVTLVGRQLPTSQTLDNQPFAQVRLRCWWHKGPLFYAEYNLRLCWYLLWAKADAIGTVDLDTLPAGWLAARLRGLSRVFDAHEYYTEVPELVDRLKVKAIWAAIARWCLPAYRHAYTVGPSLAQIMGEEYGVAFEVVRNVPFMRTAVSVGSLMDANDEISASGSLLHQGDQGEISISTYKKTTKIVLYQGALNMGRGIEAMLEAMPDLPDDIHFWLAGEGDLSAVLRARAEALGITERVRFLGWVRPADLPELTQQAWLGLNLLENKGLSYYYSLANKFFDYVQADIPIITMNFPEYSALNQEHEVAVLLDDLDPQKIVAAIRALTQDGTLYNRLKTNCLDAKKIWNWEVEKKTLLKVWELALGKNKNSHL